MGKAPSVASVSRTGYDCNHMETEEPCAPALAGVTPRMRRIAAGEVLFRQGDRTAGIYTLAAGRVRLLRVTPDGTPVTLHLARPGETFAEAALFSARYHCDAVADADSLVGLYPKAALTAQLSGDAAALWQFAGDLARRLQGLRSRYELRQIRSAPERVLQYLRLRCDADGGFHSEGTLKDIAVELGMSHEALYRALATLAAQGRVLRDGPRLRLTP